MLALLYPFERDLAVLPAGSYLLVNPAPVADFSALDGGAVKIWQWWKGVADAVSAHGTLLPAAGPGADDFYDAVLVRLPRQREEAQLVMATAWAHLKPGGIFAVAAANDTGGARLEKDLAWLGGAENASKHKCRVVWAVKDQSSAPSADWSSAGAMQQHGQTKLWTQAGLFSWDRIDPATALLLPYIPATVNGTVADLGCGYGAIAAAVLAKNPGLKKLVCMDADARAVAACEQNLRMLYPAAAVDYHWADLSRPAVFSPVDLVIMNPPFHAEKALSIDLGQAFIANAAAMLKQRGELIMVANAHLPYEALLAQSFQNVEKKFEGQGFKIFAARK